MEKHYKSVFDNEQELLKALIDLHLNGKDIECDPMYFKGNFYKDGVNRPKYISDLNPQSPDCEQYDACNLRLKLGLSNLVSIILDPPFMVGNRASQKEFYSSKTHTIYKDFKELESNYRAILVEAHAVLKKNGVLIFKCQDYTDSKTTMTHCLVYNWAIEHGFYPKDLAILVKPNKVTNPNLKQRHLRKIHTYFWVFIKS
jgi:hypothetical protein